MSSTRSPARRRAKNTLTEKFLQKVEEGSVLHISRLPTVHWPTDPDDCVLAVEVVFSVLEKEPVPSDTDEGSLNRISSSMNVLAHALTVNTSRWRTETRRALAKVYEEHFPCLFKWIKFTLEQSSRIYGEDAARSGPKFASDVIFDLYVLAAAASPELFAIVNNLNTLELLLDLYTTLTPDGKTLAALYRPKVACPLTDTLSYICRAGDKPMSVVLKAISLSSRSRQLRIVRLAKQRMQEWDEACAAGPGQRKTFGQMALATTSFIRDFMEVLPFAKLVVEEGFISSALVQSRRFSKDIVDPDNDGVHAEVAYPTAVSIKFFPNNPTALHPSIAIPIVEGMLGAGLLNILVDHLLSCEENDPHPWYAWVQDASIGHPLQVLSSYAVHPSISVKLKRFIMEQDAVERNLLDSGWRRKHWEPFRVSANLYGEIWGQQNYLVEEGRPAILCDNLKHHERFPSITYSTPVNARQCSHCRAVVYCSSACQKEDWKAFHKAECEKQRAYVEDRRKQSAWISPKHRQFLLHVLQSFVCNLYAGLPLHQVHAYTDCFDFARLILAYPNGERPCNHDGPNNILDLSRGDAMAEITTLACPPTLLPIPLDMWLHQAHDGEYTFRDPRYLAMVNEFRTAARPVRVDAESTRCIRLATSISYCGTYRIYTTGRYEVIQTRETVTAKLLNGFVKTEERIKLEIFPGFRAPC